MKPTKNQIFCIGCKHKKMLFESKAKADNFIKFNSKEIKSLSGKAPSRSYYCSFCGGWHVTSIAEEGKGIDRDKRDQELWKKIKKTNNPTNKKGGNNTESLTDNQEEAKDIKKRNKFPKTEQGVILKLIGMKIDRILSDIKNALYCMDVPRLSLRFKELKDTESEAKSKSEEFKLEIQALTKKLDKIEMARNRFLYIYDFIVDEDKRKNHLESLNDEEKLQEDNVIINNIEIINLIKKRLNEINLDETNIEQRNRYKLSCRVIQKELIPQLKGNTRYLRDVYTYRVSRILANL